MLTLAAQLAVTVTLAALPGQQFGDREAFGIRYRTPALGPVTAQMGLLTVDDNGVAKKMTAGVRHFAGALELAVTPHVRTSVIYGNFDEIRNHRDGLSDRAYYRLWAVGLDFHGTDKALTVEKVVNVPVVTTTGATIHDVVVRGRWGRVSGMATSLRSDGGMSAQHFVVAEGTFRLVGPFGLTGGTRAILDPDRNAELLRPFWGLSAQWTVGLP